MKIAQVTPYFPPHLGGMEQRILDLSEKLAQAGHEITVLTSDIGCSKNRIASKPGFRVEYLKSIVVANTPIIFTLFPKLMRLPKDTILHVHIAQALTPEIAYVAARLHGFKYVTHVRIDLSPTGVTGFLLPIYKRFFLGPVLRGADQVIVLTNDYKTIMHQKYNIPLERISVIPNATSYRISERQSLALHSPARILFVGRLHPQKNLPLLLQSFKRVISQHPLAELHIVGEGEEKAPLQKLAQDLGIEGSVVFHGARYGDELYSIYSMSDIFVLPSREELFSSTLLEAMATGIPIISSDIPGSRDVVDYGKAGMLVRQDSDDISEAILQLMNDEDKRKTLVENGRRQLKIYSWPEIIRQTQDIYQEIERVNAQ